MAQAELAAAEGIALALPALWELVWVLARGYRVPAPDIAHAVRWLIGTANLAVNRPAVEAGLAMLEAGGDLPMG